MCAKPLKPAVDRSYRSIACSEPTCGGCAWVNDADPGPELRVQGWTTVALMPAPEGRNMPKDLGKWFCSGTCSRTFGIREMRDPDQATTWLDASGNPHDPRLKAAEGSQQPKREPIPAHLECSYEGCRAVTDVPAGVDPLRWLDVHGWIERAGSRYCSKRCFELRRIEAPIVLQPQSKLNDASWNVSNDRSRKERGLPVYEDDLVTRHDDGPQVHEPPPLRIAGKPKARK